MSQITTHVLDTSSGTPAGNLPLLLEFQQGTLWKQLAQGRTNKDGRAGNLLAAEHQLEPGIYRLTFNTAEYFSGQNIEGFYPYVCIVFEIKDGTSHYHVPLLLSPFGFSTYRGS